MATTLGIDPGTNCGWALRDASGKDFAGSVNLKGGRFEGGGMRFLRFKSFLEELDSHNKIDCVFFEEVRRHRGTDAAHVYGGLIATLTSWCEEHDPKIPYSGIPVGTIKKTATGKGNADKEKMVAAAREKWPDLFTEDDHDMADALWVLETGIQSLSIS